MGGCPTDWWVWVGVPQTGGWVSNRLVGVGMCSTDLWVGAPQTGGWVGVPQTGEWL